MDVHVVSGIKFVYVTTATEAPGLDPNPFKHPRYPASYPPPYPARSLARRLWPSNIESFQALHRIDSFSHSLRLRCVCCRTVLIGDLVLPDPLFLFPAHLISPAHTSSSSPPREQHTCSQTATLLLNTFPASFVCGFAIATLSVLPANVAWSMLSIAAAASSAVSNST